MKLKRILEMVVQQQPSAGSEVDFNVEKELEDLSNAIEKYKSSQIQQFENIFKNKLVNKIISIDEKQFTVKELSIKNSETGGFVVEYITDDGKTIVTSKSVKIVNDVDGPVTNATQMTSKPTNNPHKIKQF